MNDAIPTAIRAAIRGRCRAALAMTGAIAVMLPAAGCYFDQLQRSQESDIQRVEQKRAALETEQQQSAALQQQTDQLASVLSERELSLDELNARVSELNARNRRFIADNDAARARYRELLEQVHDTNGQVVRARQEAAGELSERRRHLGALEAQLKEQIRLLLQ